MAFVDPQVALAQDEFTASATATCRLGTRAVTRDGRVFRYAQAGALALVPGTVLQSPPVVTGHLNVAATAAPIGARTFLMNAMGAVGTANQYAEGYFLGTTAPNGSGYTNMIAGHAAISATVPWSITLEDALVEANPSKVNLIAHPYKGLIIAPATLTASLAGVATYVIPANQYGWVLTWGVGAVLINGAPAVNATVVSSATTPGAVDTWTVAAGVLAVQVVGVMMQLGVTTTKCGVFVKLAA